MNKNILRVSALVLVVLMLTMALVSCGGLSGTYTTGELLGSGVSYTFKGSKVIIEGKVLGQSKTIEGKYKIDGDKITFTFADDEEGADSYAGTFDFVKGDDYIKIGLVTYNKKSN